MCGEGSAAQALLCGRGAKFSSECTGVGLFRPCGGACIFPIILNTQRDDGLFETFGSVVLGFKIVFELLLQFVLFAKHKSCVESV